MFLFLIFSSTKKTITFQTKRTLEIRSLGVIIDKGEFTAWIGTPWDLFVISYKKLFMYKFIIEKYIFSLEIDIIFERIVQEFLGFFNIDEQF